MLVCRWLSPDWLLVPGPWQRRTYEDVSQSCTTFTNNIYQYQQYKYQTIYQGSTLPPSYLKLLIWKNRNIQFLFQSLLNPFISSYSFFPNQIIYWLHLSWIGINACIIICSELEIFFIFCFEIQIQYRFHSYAIILFSWAELPFFYNGLVNFIDNILFFLPNFPEEKSNFPISREIYNLVWMYL